jgi:fibronectin-binding autotransporter adhesin
MNKNYNSISLLTATAFILALALVPSAHAANIWDGGGGDGFWNTPNNWDNDTVPAPSQNLTFSGNVQTITTNNIDSFTVGTGAGSTYAITFGNTGALGTSAFTLAGNQIVLNAGTGTGGSIISSAVTDGSITDTISLNMRIASTATISLGANHNLIITGLLTQASGTRQLTKTGIGELILRNAGNNYLGATTINNGTLTVDVAGGIQNAGVASALGAGTGANSQINFSGGTLNVSLGAGSTDRQVRIGNTNNLTSLGGANINNNSANGSNPLLFSNAAFNVSAGAITVNRLLTLGGANTDANAINGVISDNNTAGGGTVSLTKSGSGRWVLSGASTYTGGTTINEGTLALGAANRLADTGAVTVNAGTFNLGGFSDTVGAVTLAGGSITNGTLTGSSYDARNGNVAAVLAGSGALTKSTTNTVTLAGANTYTGTTIVDAGTLAVNGSLLNSGSVLVNANGFLGGSGSVGAIRGAGTIGPGNSPGILTAPSVDPTAGTDFRFEFTALNPTYSSATASGNDLLRLTSNSSPFAGGSFGAGNIISIYLNSSTINDSLLAGQNTTFSGGFFVDGTYGLAAALSPASFAYYTTIAELGTGSAVNYGDTDYYLLNSEIAAKTTLTDTSVASAGFSTGTVAGTLLTFNVVPEPSAQSLFAFGMAALVAVRALRRGRGDS